MPDTTSIVAILSALGGVLATVFGAPLVTKLVEHFFSSSDRRGDELTEYRREIAKQLAEARSEIERLRVEYDTLQERYYAQREAAVLAARDAAYYGRLAHLSARAGERAEVVARESLDALPAPNPGGEP